ncbi:MAG: hypothetical protein H6710_14100 [Myxococcales bacterium]|nr:hypothetical protein [Myxococcales bacterium]MCB9705042.1 hypothetical protein [Myxococcales bacterium]
MALSEGSDFVFCPKTTYVGGAGIGEGCLIGTRRRLLMVPLRVDAAVWNRSVTTTTWRLGDEPLGDAIARILRDPALTLGGLEETMGALAEEIEGAVLGKLDEARRVRVRAGWFSRGVYFSAREKGPGWSGFPLKGKPLALAWLDFYRGLPNFVA